MRCWIAVVACLLLAAPASAAPGWTAPFPLEGATFRPTMGPDGTVVFSGMKFVDGNFRTAVQVRPPGGPAAALQVLDQPGHSNPGPPSVAAGGDGSFIAVWPEGGDVQVARMAPGSTTFGAPAQIVPDSATSAFVDMDASGNATVVWASTADAGGGNTDYRLRATTLPADGSAGVTQVLDESTNVPAGPVVNYSPLVDVNESGAAAVLWLTRASNGSGQNVMYLRAALRKTGESFGPTLLLDSAVNHDVATAGDHTLDYQSLALGDAADIGAFWTKSTYGVAGWELEFTPGTIDGGFGALEHPPIPTSDIRGPGGIAIDAAGRTAFAFRKYPFHDLTVRPNVIFRPRGGPWGSAEEIKATKDVGGVDLAVAPDGTLMYTYTASYDNTGKGAVESAIAAPGASFGTPHVAAADLPSLQRANGALGPTGDGVVAYQYQPADFVSEAAGYDASAPALKALSIPSPATVGQSTPFSVQPIDIWSPVTTSWSFGDGGAADGESVSHAYASPGDRTVSVTATDSFGNAATANGPISVFAPPPVQAGPTPPGDTTAPVVSAFAASPSVFAVGSKSTALAAKVARGTKFKFKLSEAAAVAIRIERVLPGKRVGKRCVAPTKKLRKRKNCSRYKAVGKLERKGLAGQNSVAFSGKLGRRALGVGRYRATIVATDAAGNKSVARSAGFRVVSAR